MSEGGARRLQSPGLPSLPALRPRCACAQLSVLPQGVLSGCTSGVAAKSESRTLRITATDRFSQIREGKAECLPALSLSSSQEERNAVISEGGVCSPQGLERWEEGRPHRWQTPYRLLQDPQLRQHHAPRTGLRNRAPHRCLSSPLSQVGKTQSWKGENPSISSGSDVLCNGLEPILSFCTPVPSSVKMSLQFPLFLAYPLTEVIWKRGVPASPLPSPCVVEGALQSKE